MMGDGRSGAGAPSGYSAEPEPCSTVSAADAVSIPNAADDLPEITAGVNEWLGFAERLGPAQKRVILGLGADWGPSPDHQTAKRMWMGITGRGIKRQRGPMYVVEHKHRTDNCWRLNENGLRLQVALWHASAIEARRAETVKLGSVVDESAGPKDDAHTDPDHALRGS